MNHDKHMNPNKPMEIGDEQLSAFLDAELPEAEMEIIREQLIEDENLANRLAELAMVDELVAMSYATIDARPLANTVNNLLAEEPVSAKIIAFPLLQKLQKNIQKNVTIAASVALIIGFGVSQSLNRDSNEWQAVAQILEHTASGVELASADGLQIKPRITFVNKDGDYCRQFFMQDKKSASENIACRKNNKWKLETSVAIDKVQQEAAYQTASGGSVLDEKIEHMSSGDFFDAQAESAAINQHWSKPK
jgi:hypothetical protein